MALIDLMRHTVDVKGKAYTTDSAGGRSPTWSSVIVTGLPCNIQPAPSQVIQDYKQRDEVVTHTMYWIDSTVVITTAYRVVYDSKNYKVIGLKEDSQKGFWYRADLQIELAS